MSIRKLKTEEEAREEFNFLLLEDDEFKAQWGYCVGKQSEINPDDDRVLTYKQALEEQEKAFFEWCSGYEDLEHIKQKGVNHAN